MRAKILDAWPLGNEGEFEQVVCGIGVVTGARSLLMVPAQSWLLHPLLLLPRSSPSHRHPLPVRIMRVRFLIPILAAALVASCSTSEGPVAPAPTASVESPDLLLKGVLTEPTTVTGLKRTTPLATSVSASAYIGPLGGVISVPGTGLTVVVPALALPSKQLITITALAGSDVAYEFAPHGLKFPVPLVATQKLSNTDAGTGLIDPKLLFVGYFADQTQPNLVTELLNVSISAGTAVFPIWHFSGYIVASGRE